MLSVGIGHMDACACAVIPALMRLPVIAHRSGRPVPARLAVLLVLAVVTLGRGDAAEPADDLDRLGWITPAVRATGIEQRIFASVAAGTRVSCFVWTPPQYAVERERQFPVLYWLHGTGGGRTGIPRLIDRLDAMVRAGTAPPMLAVFPNGLAESMWCDSRDGRVPMETVIVRELVPWIDASYRTLRERRGRLLEGFSMGGYGAARFACLHPDIFGAVSILAGGPLDPDFQGPRAAANPLQRERILRQVYGGRIEDFRAESPWNLAERSAETLHTLGTRLRIAVGTLDVTADRNRRLSGRLRELGIAHVYVEIAGVGHDSPALLRALDAADPDFYRRVFASPPPDGAR